MTFNKNLFQFRARLQPLVPISKKCAQTCREKTIHWSKRSVFAPVVFFFLSLLIGPTLSKAQITTLTSTNTGNVGGSAGTCTALTFYITNNNVFDILVTDVGYAPYASANTELWYSLTSLTGAANISAPVWTLAKTVTSPAVSAAIIPNFFTGLSVIVPAGATCRFGVAVASTIRMSSTSGTNPVTGGGVAFYTTSYWAACTNASSTGYYYFGSVTFKPAAIPCTGAPTNQVNGPSGVCPGVAFNLTLATLYSGVTYNWEQSYDAVNWTPFTGTVSPINGVLTDAIYQDTWYRCRITCTTAGQSYLTAPKLVTVYPFYYCYCTGSKASSAAGIDIGNLKIATLPGDNLKFDYGPGGSMLSNAGATSTYNDYRFTQPPVIMYRDSTYKFTLKQISSLTTFAAATGVIYIDYNRNGTFELSEQVLLKTTANLLPEPGVVRDTFTMQSTATIGTTGMRVILRSGALPGDTCTSYTEGETEDYLVDIRYETCTGQANPGTVSVTDTTMCPGYTYNIADTTHQQLKSEISWSWQYSPDGVVWANMPNSANKDTFNNIMFNSTIYYRVRMVCEATLDTTYSPAQRVGTKPAYKCYCYSIANGKNADTSDIGGLGLGSLLVSQGGPHLLNQTALHARQDYTDMAPLNLWTGNKYQLMVYHTMPRSVHADAKITVFMDFDNNKKYDIPAERVGTWFTSTNDYTLIDTLTIPDSVIIDVPTGMRVILNNNTAPNIQSDNACGTYTSGETEDYIIMFRRAFPQSVANIAGMRNLGLYPNPTTGRFRIQFAGERFNNLTVTVRNITGQQILLNRYDHKGGQFDEELDMSGYAKGVYLVEIKANGEKMTRKLVVH